MRLAKRAGLTAGVLAVTVVLAGCGSSNSSGTLLSASAANQLTDELNQVERALSDYNCTVAAAAITAYEDDVSQLQGVNSTLLQMLSSGASTVRSLAEAKCPTGQTDSTTTSTDTDTVTTTSTTTTTPSVSTDTETTSTDTVPTGAGSGGAAPTTDTTTTPVTPTTETAVTPTVETQPDSGGAGIGSTDTVGTGQ